MTPSEKWMLGLFAVYGIPSFLSGVGMTLAFVRWQSRTVTGLAPGLLSPERMFEQDDGMALGFLSRDEGHGVLDGLGLRSSADI